MSNSDNIDNTLDDVSLGNLSLFEFDILDDLFEDLDINDMPEDIRNLVVDDRDMNAVLIPNMNQQIQMMLVRDNSPISRNIASELEWFFHLVREDKFNWRLGHNASSIMWKLNQYGHYDLGRNFMMYVDYNDIAITSQNY